MSKSVWIIFSPKCIINFTGSTLYEEFLCIMRHSLLYFAILPYINELWRPAPNSKKILIISGVWIIFGLTIYRCAPFMTMPWWKEYYFMNKFIAHREKESDYFKMNNSPA